MVRRRAVDRTFLLPQRSRTSDTAWWEANLLCRMILHSPLDISSVAELVGRSSFARSVLGMTSAKTKSNVRFQSEIRSRLEELAGHCPAGVFTSNSQSLAELLGLDAHALAVVRLASIQKMFKWIESILDDFCDGTLGYLRVAEFLADVLGIPRDRLLESLEPDSPLVGSGIMEVHLGSPNLGSLLDMPDSLAQGICTDRHGLEGILRPFVDSTPRVDLALEDFPHLAEATGALRDWLSTPASFPVCHVLLSGPPGTGKTQYALALCQALGKHPSLAPSETPKGTAAAGSSRRTALALAMQMIRSDPSAVLVVDEAENLVESDSFALMLGRKSSPSPEKAWLNRFLEDSPVPMIWIVNTPDALDPSVLRRFTWTIPFRIPPRRIRRRILDRHLGSHGLSESFLEELAERDDLAPHEASRLARIAYMTSKSKEDRLRLAMDLSDRFLARSRPTPVSPSTRFDPALLNLTTDPLALLESLTRRKSGRLGFFGPPGTGKTMLATEIARSLDRPLVLKTGSDLLGMYVGQTEKAIAKAFEEAADEEAVLFLDEVDSIASDRTRAVRSWERTQTNELLVRLERFGGVAILATNHLDDLDPALARRIDRKVEFRDLRTEQAWSLFLRHVPADAKFQPLLERLEGLRLGDFAAALRAIQIQELDPTAPVLLEALRQELDFRPSSRRRAMGFTT